MKIKFSGRYTVEEFIAAFNEHVTGALQAVGAKYVSGVNLYLHSENEEMTAVLAVARDVCDEEQELIFNIPNTNNHKKRKQKNKAEAKLYEGDGLLSAPRSGSFLLKDFTNDYKEPIQLQSGDLVSVGDFVEHNFFGAGKISRITQDRFLIIDFKKVRKLINPMFAELKLIAN